MTAPDHVAIVRDALIHGPPYAESDDVTSLAALDALVAERDEALARLSSIGGYEGYSNAWGELERRAEAAEAQVAKLREALPAESEKRAMDTACEELEAYLSAVGTEEDHYQRLKWCAVKLRSYLDRAALGDGG